MAEIASKNDAVNRQAGNQCEMPECASSEDVKACRDPEGNLLDMCASCRSGWPVEVLE